MAAFLNIRSMRDQMSANERRIADFILDNAHLLRDYSSQQLASALKISQSSVVKFSQKLGFKGYPDLKYSVSEALARDGGAVQTRRATPATGDGEDDPAQDLWRAKTHAEEETRLINSGDSIESVAEAVDRASRVFCAGAGEDGIAAHAFATKLATLGIQSVYQPDPVLMQLSIASADANDVLFVFCEHGEQGMVSRLATRFRERRGQVVSLTRNTANALRAQVQIALLISAHDDRPHIKPLLYQCALQHLLDLIFISLCAAGRKPHSLSDD